MGEIIDKKIGKTWNNDLRESMFGWLEEAQEKKEAFDNKLDNPAPNTSKNIEGRMGR